MEIPDTNNSRTAIVKKLETASSNNALKSAVKLGLAFHTSSECSCMSHIVPEYFPFLQDLLRRFFEAVACILASYRLLEYRNHCTSLNSVITGLPLMMSSTFSHIPWL